MLTVYSKNNCPFCVQAKNLLTLKNIPFTEIKIDEDSTAKEFVLNEGHRTVPQIYLDGKLFVQGGYQGLSKLTEDQLKEKLSVTE
jgi:glutaredoxin 3